MNELFNPIEWLQERSKLNIQTFVCEGLPFQIMALSDDLVADLKEFENYDDAIEFAADHGVAVNRQRVSEQEGLKDDLTLFWSKVHEAKKVDPCVKHRVGEQICEISGLTGHVESLLLVIDGDDLTGEDLEKSLGEFQERVA